MRCQQAAPAQAAALPIAAFRIGAVDDAAEARADAAADRVLRRRCADCEREETLARRADGGAVSGDARSAVGAVLAGGGRPLPAADAAFFGAGLGADLGGVRIHDGPAADRAARSVGARAFALEANVVFASGEYRPQEAAGRHLLAHELAHVAEGDGALRRQAAPARPHVFREQGVTVLVRPSCSTTAGFSFAIMEAAIRTAIDTIINNDCIRASFRRPMAANLRRNGLDFRCADSANLQTPGACAEATGFSTPANIFTIGTAAITSAGCGPLHSTIMHEIIHVVRGFFGEELPRSCEASCFGQAGDPALCRGPAP